MRFTSEIILANIILLEKYRNEPTHAKIQFIPMMPDVDAMLVKADTALVMPGHSKLIGRPNTFTLDHVEEWNDLTGLPYVHGFWVGREEQLSNTEAQALLTAKHDGVLLKAQIAQSMAQQMNYSLYELTEYISSFSYDFGEKEEESLVEFIHYAYFHGVIGDVPEVQFFDLESGSLSQN